MNQTSIDVAVIGGGISGLTVAKGLLAAGQTVQLFEARPRLGGRIHSMPIAGGIAELGATWFWDNETRVQTLIDDFEIETHDQWETGDSLVASQGQLTRYSRPWSANSRRFSGGASQLIDCLANLLPEGTVHLNSPVLQVKPAGDTVTVQLEDRLLQARRVVVAIPPPLALANNIVDGADIEPDLRDVASRVAVWMGATVKALAFYEEPFWRADGLSGSASSQTGPMHEIHDISGVNDSPGILFGFGQTHPDTADLDSEDFIQQLTTLFGPKAAEPIDVTIRDWRQEPWTTPATWPPSDRYDLFGSPLLQRPTWDGKLFWSSTETAAVSPGHIEGALAAAERTIEAITQLEV